MFRKLVANIAFSPALVAQLGFYARRLSREEATRRLGLILTVLALIVQTFAIAIPPESANAANPNDIIYGGFRTKDEAITIYDRSSRGNGDFADILTYAGITRDELVRSSTQTINSRESGTGSNAWKSWGRSHRFSSAEGEVKHVVPTATGTTTVYSRPLHLYDKRSSGSDHQVLRGMSAKAGEFAILFNCGNLVIKKLPTPAPEARFLRATCDTIYGLATDKRKPSAPVSVYLYFGGPAGKGTRVGPIMTGADNRFTYAVPERYKANNRPTSVFGIMTPLAGWSEQTVHFSESVTIPGNCTPPQAAQRVTCDSLQERIIDRNRVSFIGKATVENGAKISEFLFRITNVSGSTKPIEKTVATTNNQADSGIITLSEGSYKAVLVVRSPTGEITSPQCAAEVAISPPSRCPYTPTLAVSDAECKPCDENGQIWINDDECLAKLTSSKSAINLSRNSDATTVVASSSDRIQYTVSVENIGTVASTIDMIEDLGDVLEYATIQDNGSGVYNDESKTLSWGSVRLQPNERQTRTFVVAIVEKIPATSRGSSDPGSFDCRMDNAFGNTVSIDVDCPDQKQVEAAVTELPKTGPTYNFLFAGALTTVVTYFWARARQLKKEVKLIRKEFNAGSL